MTSPAAPGAPLVESAGPRSSRSERTRHRREEIVRAARDVFSAKGYRSGSLADIAERVGITHQGVLHHFGSKEQLLVEVLRERDDSRRTEYAQPGRPTGAEFLHHVLRTVARNTGRSGIVQAYTVLAAESVTDEHPAQDWFRDRFSVLRSDLAHALGETCGPDLVVPPAELDRGAAALVAVMDGLQVQWLLAPDAVDMPMIVRATMDALLVSWGGRPLPADPHPAADDSLVGEPSAARSAGQRW